MAVVGDLANLQYSSSSSTGYTTFAQIEKIKHFTVEAPTVVTTPLNATNETSQPGIPDLGEITGQLKFASSMYTTIMGWVNNKTVMYFKTQVNDGSSPTTGSYSYVQGWIKSFSPIGDIERNKVLLSDITIKVTGADTFTAGS